jgi:ribonuclease BN (tRNA processing enzyme)
LIFATKYPDSNRRKIPLTILAGKGFQTFFKGLQAVYGSWIELPQGMLHIVELDNSLKDLREFEYFRVETMPVDHREESIAFKITDSIGHSVVYSGDTDYTENLISLSHNADLLICESALPDNLKVSGHLSPSLAGKIASLANVKKLVLTHLYPECDQVDITAQCRKTYAGPLVIAEDLLRIEL